MIVTERTKPWPVNVTRTSSPDARSLRFPHVYFAIVMFGASMSETVLPGARSSDNDVFPARHRTEQPVVLVGREIQGEHGRCRGDLVGVKPVDPGTDEVRTSGASGRPLLRRPGSGRTDGDLIDGQGSRLNVRP